jgi:hypothetical protein
MSLGPACVELRTVFPFRLAIPTFRLLHDEIGRLIDGGVRVEAARTDQTEEGAPAPVGRSDE